MKLDHSKEFQLDAITSTLSLFEGQIKPEESFVDYVDGVVPNMLTISKEEILKNFNISKYLLEDKNLGYSKGHNKAASYIESDYLLILNADCLIDEENFILLSLNNTFFLVSGS